MTPRMNENLLKVVFFIAIFMAILLQSLFANAQPEGKRDTTGSPVKVSKSI
ncbi:MAG: hypothetical protein WA874_03535 [Chryseosolibacter sp.]